ncbi:hypothetical protein SanaruYs_17540 [Chryseotalea sanaruensis]|uniref:DUF2892 domain-containing protein n=1 Tax=Chryseotalea sanaruensis TaxID=2482724 RepID=A0A401U9H5_9BACT|nr:hypothetical protein [Chryseotalea sanaruensis]GCC51529.1 hypothetical protein SanaruYs_17540 [Chryseotalea sanaruensis]
MKAITNTLFSNWHFMRWLRLGLGLFVAYQAFTLHDTFAGIIAGLFLFQAFTNAGCCGSVGCAVPTKKEDTANVDQVTYEVVKSKVREQPEKS